MPLPGHAGRCARQCRVCALGRPPACRWTWAGSGRCCVSMERNALSPFHLPPSMVPPGLGPACTHTRLSKLRMDNEQAQRTQTDVDGVSQLYDQLTLWQQSSSVQNSRMAAVPVGWAIWSCEWRGLWYRTAMRPSGKCAQSCDLPRW